MKLSLLWVHSLSWASKEKMWVSSCVIRRAGCPHPAVVRFANSLPLLYRRTFCNSLTAVTPMYVLHLPYRCHVSVQFAFSLPLSRPRMSRFLRRCLNTACPYSQSAGRHGCRRGLPEGWIPSALSVRRPAGTADPCRSFPAPFPPCLQHRPRSSDGLR